MVGSQLRYTCGIVRNWSKSQHKIAASVYFIHPLSKRLALPFTAKQSSRAPQAPHVPFDATYQISAAVERSTACSISITSATIAVIADTDLSC